MRKVGSMLAQRLANPHTPRTDALHGQPPGFDKAAHRGLADFARLSILAHSQQRGLVVMTTPDYLHRGFKEATEKGAKVRTEIEAQRKERRPAGVRAKDGIKNRSG